MEAHRQACQACGSIDVRNILTREPGRAPMVFVRCAKCGELVARYRLQSYYHHGKGVESFLRSQGLGDSDSGREQLEEFRQVKAEALDQFERALQVLRDENKEV